MFYLTSTSSAWRRPAVSSSSGPRAQALQPTKDELTRKMTHVELICEGHLLQDNNVTVTGAKISSTSEVQALYRINVLECSCNWSVQMPAFDFGFETFLGISRWLVIPQLSFKLG